MGIIGGMKIISSTLLTKCDHVNHKAYSLWPQKRKMRPSQERNPFSLTAKKKNAAKPKAEPTLSGRKKEKCGQAKGRAYTLWPQKRKMRPSQKAAPHSLAAKKKNTATPRTKPLFPVLESESPIFVDYSMPTAH